jgi:DNA-binding transcriptional regulator PaaX
MGNMPDVKRNRTAIQVILRGLMPYTRENLLLSTNPSRFFHELEKTSGYKLKTFQNAAWKAEKDGLIKREDNLIKITEKGKRKVKDFEAVKLSGPARLMVIFDIPEQRAADRNRLRALLYEWQFKQAQKSVWISNYDYRKPLVKAVDELGLNSCVQIYECARLYPRR